MPRPLSAALLLVFASLASAAAAGAVTGRVGRHALRAGSYRASLTATDAAGNISAASSAGFAIAAG